MDEGSNHLDQHLNYYDQNIYALHLTFEIQNFLQAMHLSGIFFVIRFVAITEFTQRNIYYAIKKYFRHLPDLNSNHQFLIRVHYA